MNNPREFIDNIADNDNLEAEMHFTNIMIDKVGSSLEDRRYDLANDLVNEKKEMTANQILRDTGKKKPEMTDAELAVSSREVERILRGEMPPSRRATAPTRGKKKDPDPTRSDAKGKRKGDLPKRTGDGGVAADMEIAGGKAPSKPNKELDIGAGPKKPSKKPKVVQPGDTKHPLDTSDIESGATGGQPKKPQVGTGDHHPTKKPGRSPGALGGRRPPKKSDRVFDFE
jgi:hypothetical protein